jgi:hypothetical protein
MTDSLNYDVLNRAAAREVETLIDIQTQQTKNKLLTLCDLQHFTSKYNKLWDMGGLEFKPANESRVKLAKIEANPTIDNREFEKFREGISVVIDINQLHQSEVKDQYKTRLAESIRYGAERAFDKMIYHAFDATYWESINSDLAPTKKTHSFLQDGNEQMDFSAITAEHPHFNYNDFRSMILWFAGRNVSAGLAFVCSEIEREQLRSEVNTNVDYVRSSGAIFDKFGNLEFLNGVRIVTFGSQARVGDTIVGKTKNSPAGKRACFMFNTNEGGGSSAITYDVEPLNLEFIRINDELKAWALVGDYKIGAIRKASGFVIRALTNNV